MLKFKRIIVLLFVVAAFSMTTYGAVQNLLVANQTEYRSSAIEKSKLTKDNSAVVNITSGPIRDRNTILAYVKCTSVSTYITETGTFNYPKSIKLYYNNPFDYTQYMNKKYKVYAKVRPYSYSTTVTVAGDFTP